MSEPDRLHNQRLLAKLEAELEEAERQSYLARGLILKDLRGDGPYNIRFYKVAGYENFAEYCVKQLGCKSRRPADRQIAAYRGGDDFEAPGPRNPSLRTSSQAVDHAEVGRREL